MFKLRKSSGNGLPNPQGGSSEYKHLIYLSLIFFVIAMIIHCISGIYVSTAQAVHVPDLILDHVRPVNVGFFYIYGYMVLFTALFLYPGLYHTRTLHVVISQFSILVILRSIFISFTHLQTPPDAIPVTFPWLFQEMSFQNDMFFSGHTAIPFLGFLLFKERIRYFFLFGSIVMGIVVLLAHIHYSIDVMAAFFITYSSFKMGNVLIEKAEQYVRNDSFL